MSITAPYLDIYFTKVAIDTTGSKILWEIIDLVFLIKPF